VVDFALSIFATFHLPYPVIDNHLHRHVGVGARNGKRKIPTSSTKMKSIVHGETVEGT
jgi:hypothetical protein